MSFALYNEVIVLPFGHLLNVV